MIRKKVQRIQRHHRETAFAGLGETLVSERDLVDVVTFLG